jgi:hypothetical protein
MPVGSLFLGAQGVLAQVDGQSRIQIGYTISPVPLTLDGKNPALVGLGSYLVNGPGACNSCHVGSRNDNAGLFLAGGEGPNLTPDDSGLPNGLTQQQFFDIMRNGLSPEGNPISTDMPWEFYRYMTNRDLNAIYQYLLSIPTQPGPR